MPYVGNQPAANFASVTKDTFNGGDTSGASSVSVYTLSKAATTNGVAVFVENVRQEPTTAYSVSGTTLTFTGTTPSGTNNVYVLHHNAPASTATHPSAQDLTAANATLTGDVTVGSGTAADRKIVFDGNAQDYHIGLDDSTDSLTIGLGSTLGTTAHIISDANGHVTKPLQPCFLARNSSDQSNISLATLVTVVFDTEVFDQNADFASNTFTAPVTGRYLFTYNVNFSQTDADHTVLQLTLSTSNNAFTNNPAIDPSAFTGDPSIHAMGGAVICDMDANDTALVKMSCEGGLAQTDIVSNGVRTNFGGVLLC